MKHSFGFTVSYWGNLNFNQIFVIGKNENTLQKMQDSIYILVRKKKKIVSARSPARVPVFLQLVKFVKKKRATVTA